MTRKKYYVVLGESRQDLIDGVEHYLNDGWALEGSLIVHTVNFPGNDVETFFLQAMTKVVKK